MTQASRWKTTGPGRWQSLQLSPHAVPPSGRGAILGENGLRRLPRPGDGSDEGTVPRPRIPVQGTQISDHRRAERIQVEGADEFEEVRLLLSHDGLVVVLEEVTARFVPPVEGVSQGRMRRERRLRGKGRLPVRTRR